MNNVAILLKLLQYSPVSTNYFVDCKGGRLQALVSTYYRATYRMLSGLLLFEGGGERDRRNHSHWSPLLRLLANVDGLSGEWFKRRFEAGKQLLLIITVILLHCGAATTQQWTSGFRAERNRKRDLILGTRCARPREPIGGGQHAGNALIGGYQGQGWWRGTLRPPPPHTHTHAHMLQNYHNYYNCFDAR